MTTATSSVPSSNPHAAAELPPLVRVYQMATAYRFSRALYVAVELGIADRLKDGAKSAEDLAAATQTNADALFRLLRALASVGIFAEAGPRKFALTPLPEALRSDVPGSARPVVLMLAGDMHWSVYRELGYSVRTGHPAFDHVFGQDLWQYLSGHPEISIVVDTAITVATRMMGPVIAGAYDFSKFETIIDVGGGAGELLAAILKQHARPRGIVFDLPHAIEHARAAALLPEGRSELIAGKSGTSTKTTNVPAVATLRPGDVVPSIELRGPDNSPAQLVRPGRLRAVLFTAAWCESYLKNIEPKTVEACRRAREEADEMSKNDSVEWLGVFTPLWTTPKALASYQARMKPRMPMAVDTEEQAFQAFGIHAFPAVALIDADGRLFRILGPNDDDLPTAIGELAARHQK